MPTTLQLAINKIREEIKREQKLSINPYSGGRVAGLEFSLERLESLLREEEQMIRDAWEAGWDTCVNWKFGDRAMPDLETYIQNLKK